MDLEDLDNEKWLSEYKKNRRAHLEEIIDSSMLSEQEKDWIEEYPPRYTTDITYNEKEDRYVERITLPNLFDMVRRNRQS